MSLRARIRKRSGLTVVEVLVALTLVTVGLCGIAGASALALRSFGAATRELRAVERASLRIAWLQAEGCGPAHAGESAPDASGMREHWSVRSARGGAALLDETMEWTEGHAWRSLHVESARLC